jgi:hypothetical protein
VEPPRRRRGPYTGGNCLAILDRNAPAGRRVTEAMVFGEDATVARGYAPYADEAAPGAAR